MGDSTNGAAPLEKVTALFKAEKAKDWDQWEVLEMDVHERLGHPTEGTLVIAAKNNKFDFRPLLGKSCVLILSRGVGRKRYFKGIVYRIEHRGEYPFGSVAAITFASAFMALQHGQDSRVFERRTAPQIIEEVLKEALGPLGRKARLKLSRTYPVREYCVQYKESDWDFIHRLMTDEGITFYLDEGGKETDREVVVLVDSNDAFPEIETMGGESETAASPRGDAPEPLARSVTVRIRTDAESAAKHPERLRLFSTDGSFEQTQRPGSGVQGEGGFAELTFTDVPTYLSYSLELQEKGEEPYVIFTDVAFARLDRLGER